MIYKILEKIERKINTLQGKGWGTSTINNEILTLKSLNKNIKIAIDIGGNIGDYSMNLLSNFPEIEIHIFEPSKYNFEILEKRFFGNKKITINKVALGNSIGEYKLFSNNPGSGLASLTKRNLDHFGIEFNYEEAVTLSTFEHYWENVLQKKNIDFIKIDVEGHELDVMKGMGKAIENIKIIQFEFGGTCIDTRTFFQDYWYFFKNNSFKIFRIGPLGLNEIKNYKESDEYFLTTNYLCVKN